MKKLKLFFAACALLLGVSNAWGYTTDDLESAGWTKVTSSSITGTGDNYYMLVDCNSSAYVMANQADHFRPCYKTIDNPVENPSFVWVLEGSNNEFNLKSYSTGAYFKQASGWNTSVGNARDGRTKVTGVFELNEGKYTLKCKETSNFIGHWNDNGAAVASDGENIAANKQAKDAPGFFLYSISKSTFDAALSASRSSAVSSATKESPADVTSYIQNADWSGDWGGWESTFASSGNMQWGQKTLESWNASNVIFKQELRGVPNGTYRLTADVISGPGATKAAYVYAIGTSKVSSDVVSAEASAGNYNTMSNEVAGNTLTADNIVVTNNTITIGLDQSTGWIVADNFKLYYLGVDLEEFIKAYNAALTTAQGFEGKLFDEDWATLNAVITANTLNTASATQDELTTATANLNAANEVAAVAATKYTTYTNANTLINGGENVDLTSLIVNPSFEDSFTGWTNTGGMATQGNSSFGKTGSYYCEYWQPNGTKGVSQTIAVLPSGLYSMTVRVKARGVTSAKLFANTNEKAITIEDKETEYSLTFEIADKASINIGFEGVGTGAGNSWLAFDNFRLTYVGTVDDLTYTKATGKMGTDKSAAQDAAEATFLAEKTIANYNALIAAIADAEASKTNYEKLKAAIDKAEAVKTANSFVTADATSAFESTISTATNGWTDVTFTDAQATEQVAVLGTGVSGWRANATGAAGVYVASAWGKNSDNWWDAPYINTWSTEGDNDGTGFSVPFFEYYTGDKENLGANTFTATLSGLDNGCYEVELWARAQRRSDADFNGDNSMITMSVNGGDATSIMSGQTTVGSGSSVMRLGRYTARGMVTDGTLTLSIDVVLGSNVHWLCWRDVKYTKVADESVTVSDAGYATYVSNNALDFSETSIKAYKVKVNTKGVATMTQVDEVPAGTPVLLYKEGGATEDIPVIASADAVSDNDLVAGTGAAVATEDGGGYTNMILNNVGGNVGFYFAAGQIVATNRAYLHIATDLAPNPENGARMVMRFAGEITGINEAAASAEAALKDGKYVEAGKVVIYRNGKKFNTTGAQMK